MKKVYTIECMKVAFNSYNEAEHWRRWYNHKYPNDYIDPTEIKWYYIFELAGCVSCPKFPWCTLMPDECEADPISEDELKGETNGAYSESLDW